MGLAQVNALNARRILPLAGLLMASTLAVPAIAADVTPDRLLNAAAEPENWLMVNKTYDSHRYSGLDVIHTGNVADLGVAFTVAIGGASSAGAGGFAAVGGHQSTPLVEDGMMYVVDGYGTVYKINVRSGTSGRIEWVMDPGIDVAELLIPANRGVVLYNNRVISITGAGDLNWTNVDTGELLQSIRLDDVPGFGTTAPPLAIGDKLIHGTGFGDLGVRSYIAGYDAVTGDEIWRTYAIPGPGEPGHETWGGSEAWATGGAGFWQVGSYDPDTNLTIWGTGNPVPMYDPEARPGDNLYTNSALALDVDTGEIAWYFQYTPGDFLDFDEIGIHLLIDAEVDGEMRSLVSHFGRNGFFYSLDRMTGEFIAADQYVSALNWTAGIDPKTGLPIEYDPDLMLQTYAIGEPSRREQGGILTCPHIQGGVNYFPTTYSDRSGYAYGAGIDEGCQIVTADPEAGGQGGGAELDQPARGSVAASDPATGDLVARAMTDFPIYSGITSTGGSLVFTVTAEGTMLAFDDETLEELWRFGLGTFASAPPMTYGYDGKQYVAVLAGAGLITQGLVTSMHPEMADLQNTSMLFVFGL